jgi:hypothetical protein
MSRMRHTTLKQYLTEIRDYLKLARETRSDAYPTPTALRLRETMIEHTMDYIGSSDIDIDRLYVRSLMIRFLMRIADRHAQGFTLGRVRDEPYYLGEQITDPCGKGHTVRDCPKRRRK